MGSYTFGLLLRLVFSGLLDVHECVGLDGTVCLVQAATLLEITTQLVEHIDHEFSHICDILGTIGPLFTPFYL